GARELAPGGNAILVRNAAAFSLRYGAHPIAGEFGGRLNNAGERLTLIDASGEVVRTLHYGDSTPWPEAADGGGFALRLLASSERPDHELAAHWTAGSPLNRPDPVGGVSLAAWLEV